MIRRPIARTQRDRRPLRRRVARRNQPSRTRSARPQRRVAYDPADLWEELELSNWWADETREYHEFILRILASMPGGEAAEDMGFEPFGNFLGWQEIKMLTEMLDKIQYAEQVDALIQTIMGPDEEDEDYNEEDY